MSVGSREIALFVVDCSASMGRPREMSDGHGGTRTVSPLQVSMEYVKGKIVQRILRDLKTTPCGVLTYGVEKTKNSLTHKLKTRDGDEYSKHEDPYRHYFEEVPISWLPERGMLEHLDSVEAGKGPDGKGKTWFADMHTALILAFTTLMTDSKSKNFKKKEVYLFTDGESKSLWDSDDTHWKGTVAEYNQAGISLTVVGFNFDDEDVDYVEESKSIIKQENEDYLKRFIGELKPELQENSIIATTSRAVEAMAQPRIREVNSQSIQTVLTLGDPDKYPEQSLSIYIDIKKGTSPAAVKSMKSMSTRGFEKEATQASQAPPSATETASKFGNLVESFQHDFTGVFAQMGSEHGVTRETDFYYRPSDVPLVENEGDSTEIKDEDGAEKDDGEKEGENGDDDERLRPVEVDNLTPAYYYGGGLVDIGDMVEGTGELPGKKTGMEILTFSRMANLRYDWRHGDVLYVLGGDGQSGAQLAVSALVAALLERNCVAVVRYTGKGMNSKGVFKVPDPKIGILYPVNKGEDLDYFVFVQMPYQEDIRAISFPSFSRVYNRKGQPLTEHKLIPTSEMKDSMEKYIEEMSLVVPAENEDEEETSWFTVEDSFSPAIHNLEQTLVNKMSTAGELPPPPVAITKYLDPPPNVVARAETSLKRAIDTLDVKLVPPRPKKISKKVNNFNPEASEIPFDLIFTSNGAPSSTVPFPGNDRSLTETQSQTQSQSTIPSQKPSTPPKSKVSAQKFSMDVDEDDEKEESSAAGANQKGTNDDGDESGPEPDTDDDEDDEGPTQPPPTTTQVSIGLKDPLGDFETALKAHGASPAIKQMVGVVDTLVQSSFSNAKYKLAIESLRAARDASVNEPKIYNEALSSWVSQLLKNRKKKDFAPLIEQEKVGLITNGKGGASKEVSVLFLKSLTA